MQEPTNRRPRHRSHALPKVIYVRTTEAEHEEISRRSRASTSPSVSRFMINCALNRRLNVRPSAPLTDDDRVLFERFLFELRRSQVALDRISTHLLITVVTEDVPTNDEITDVLETINAAARAVLERLK